MNRPDLWASAFLTALAAAACVAAYRLGLGDIGEPGPGFMPLATAAVLGLMALGQLARQLAAAGDGAAGVALGRGRWGQALVVLGALAGFGRALETVGFAISAGLMLAVLFWAVARKRWWVALIVAVVVAAIVRLVFKALGVPLPEGPLGL